MPGRVYLVGAGPGDPGLITLRGAECLAQADIVLYDYLVNPSILSLAPQQAEQICLGKHGVTRIWTQAEINQRLVTEAQAGKRVVRLKGGDPTIFGRIVDECEALNRADVEFEIVPGVTAAVAAGGFAGIPITHREHASAVAFVTGQETEKTSSLDYRKLADFPGTVVIYMGTTTVESWSQAMIEGGRDEETPVALVRHCSNAGQEITRCRLQTVATEIRKAGMRPPVIAIIGEVAASQHSLLSQPQRPLAGVRVMVTRSSDQQDELCDKLARLGAETIRQPAIRVTAPDDLQAVDNTIQRLGEYDWIVFSSTNGVNFFINRLLEVAHDIRVLSGLKIAAVGRRTAEALGRFHLAADFVPSAYRSEALADELASQADQQRFLLIRANRGREVMADRLRVAGANVDQLVAYHSHDVQDPDPQALRLLEEKQIDWVTVTSSAIARSLAQMFGDTLRNTRLASISPITSGTLTELGFAATVEAGQHTMDGIVAEIRRETGDSKGS